MILMDDYDDLIMFILLCYGDDYYDIEDDVLTFLAFLAAISHYTTL